MAAYVDPMYFLPCKKSERLPKKGEVHLFVLMPELSLTVAYFVRILLTTVCYNKHKFLLKLSFQLEYSILVKS